MNTNRSFLFLVVLLVFISGVALTWILNSVWLPAPERACAAMSSWHGIVPGRSKREDVITALGSPIEIGTRFVAGRDVSFLAYPIKGGIVSQFKHDRVYLRFDGTVDWIEEVIADREGVFQPVGDALKFLGESVDRVEVNYRITRFEFMGSPEDIYVWSECGLALMVDTYCYLTQQSKLICTPTPDGKKSIQRNPITLNERYPLPTPNIEAPLMDADYIVLMRVLFRPTSFNGFLKSYADKIPFKDWEEYRNLLK
jgi:hypothetical protein